MNIGEMINIYIIKYIIDVTALFIDITLVIHPMWVIDEYAINDLNFDWFRPINPPNIAFIVARIGIRIDCLLIYDVINARILKGPSFCQVLIIRFGIHDIEFITLGNHMWHGTIPSLIVSAITIIIKFIFVGVNEVVHWLIDDIRISLEPIAWARKYFAIASVSWNLFDELIIGMKLIRLISNLIHNINQFDLDIIIIVLIIIVV